MSTVALQSTTALTWSPQQQAVIDAVADGDFSVFAEAVAGSGKTTTIIGAMQALPARIRFVAIAAFNTDIAKIVAAKIVAAGLDPRRFVCKTFHGFGFAAWRKAYTDVRLDQFKMENMADEVDAETQQPFVAQHLRAFALRLCGLAKNAGFGGKDCPGRLVDECVEGNWHSLIAHHDLAYDLEDERDVLPGLRAALRLLRKSRDVAHEVINFDDQIYMPVVGRDGKLVKVWQNDLVVVDEWQDANMVRIALTQRMKLPRGKVFLVGDRAQSIYGFTGADANAVAKGIDLFKCQEMPLSVTFRCARRVVEEARKIVPQITARDGAEGGTVSRISLGDLLKADDLSHRDAILCRKTAPLVNVAFSLLRKGVACHVEGRDIGKGIAKLAMRWKVKRTEALKERLEAYLARETIKLTEKKQDARLAALTDQVQTLIALCEGCETVDQVIAKIDGLFLDGNKEPKPTLTLATAHRSKGREWQRVFILGRHQYMPSPWARQEWQAVQEDNLIYVAVTRAQRDLVYVDVPTE